MGVVHEESTRERNRIPSRTSTLSIVIAFLHRVKIFRRMELSKDVKKGLPPYDINVHDLVYPLRNREIPS